MPQVELCAGCKKEVDVAKEKFVVISKSVKDHTRVIAHPECARHTGPVRAETEFDPFKS